MVMFMSTRDPVQELTVTGFLADSVVTAEGKLYVQGAGWNVIWTQEFPARQPRLGIGLIVSIPYTETNQPHTLDVRIDDGDGRTIQLGTQPDGSPLTTLGGSINVGRPPNLAHGDEQLVAIGLNIDGMEFGHPDRYGVIVELDGEPALTLPFRVMLAQQT
jgi:hypothetical protein